MTLAWAVHLPIPSSIVCEWVLTVAGLSHSSSKGQPSDGIEQR